MPGRGPLPKPGAVRPVSDRAHKPELARVGDLDAPDPPSDLLPSTRQWWFDYWASDVARAVQANTDVPALARLALLMDERERASAALRALPSPVTQGSQGQDVIHPLTKYVATLDAEIRQLEDRFGLNPRARLSLGLQLTQARRTLEDLYDEKREEAGSPPIGEAPIIDLAAETELE